MKNPIKTGGALLKASKMIILDQFFAINGDTFKVDVKELLKLHQKKKSELSLCFRDI